MSAIQDLFEALEKSQQPKGFFFNKDRDRVFDVLADLLRNRERYGYMSCPCRLAAENREKDRDIICPCHYRNEDVADYGSCYCNLYVSQAWNDETIPHVYVPERRPVEKLSF